ncbi:MAG: glycosyltransferase [Hyphomicrobium sp.]
MSRYTVAILSPYFPPSTLAGVHRARHLAKHLPSFGWQPIILCVDEAFHEETLDPGLARLLPSDIEVIKTAALPAQLTRPVKIGDITIRAFRQLRSALFELIQTRPIDVILITGAPYYAMMLAPEIKRRTGPPVVLDFQDPWVSSWGALQSTYSKSGLAHRLASALEPRAVRAAAFITSVSETQNAEMALRYPWLDRKNMAAIPIGGDPEDFKLLRASPIECAAHPLDPSRINLSYVGTCLPRAEPVMRVLFRAAARFRATHPDVAQKLRLNFVGTSNQPNERATRVVTDFAEAEGVGDMISETPFRVPYLQAIDILARSDGLLLIGSDEPHYTASKIYPALMSGRPYLSIFYRASSSNEILSLAGGGESFSFATLGELETQEAAIAKGLATLVIRPQSMSRVDHSAFAAYEANSIASRFADIFNAVASRAPKSNSVGDFSCVSP